MMRPSVAAMLLATYLGVAAASSTPSPEAQDDLQVRVISADEAGGFIAAVVTPAPHILMQSLGGPMPKAGDKLPCELGDENLTCRLPDGRVIDLLPLGFMLMTVPPDLRVGNLTEPLAAKER